MKKDPMSAAVLFIVWESFGHLYNISVELFHISVSSFQSLNFKLILVSDNATDCTSIYNRGERTNGIYSIKPNGSESFNVYCEMKTGKSSCNFSF